jgi:hypothetical protein
MSTEPTSDERVPAPSTGAKRQRKPRAPIRIYTDAEGVEWFKAGAAMDELGMNKNEFYDLSHQTWFPKKRFEGKKQDLYRVRDIKALKLLLRSGAEEYSPNEIVFSRSSPADLLEAEPIEIRCFGREFAFPAGEALKFQRVNAFTFWSLKAYGKVVGSLSTFRFSPDVLDALLTGRLIEREVSPEETLAFERLAPFDVYVGPMALDPELSTQEQEQYAAIIVRRFADTLLQFLVNDYQIGHLYTVTSPQRRGDLVERWGFQRLEGKSIAPSRVAYVYPLDEEGVARLREVGREVV